MADAAPTKMVAPTKTALLVMDLQPAIINHLGEIPEYLTAAAKTIAAARSKSIPVVFVVIDFRTGFPEVSTRNKQFGRILALSHVMKTGSAGADPKSLVLPQVAPADPDIVVVKKRYSAFAGSDLEIVLRGLGAENLVLAGISTGGVVLSTLREAADKDFGLTVLEDLCLDPDEEVHRVLMKKIFPKSADVVQSADWLAGL
jgi:nicotinamidase-related amidase